MHPSALPRQSEVVNPDSDSDDGPPSLISRSSTERYSEAPSSEDSLATMPGPSLVSDVVLRSLCDNAPDSSLHHVVSVLVQELTRLHDSIQEANSARLHMRYSIGYELLRLQHPIDALVQRHQVEPGAALYIFFDSVMSFRRPPAVRPAERELNLLVYDVAAMHVSRSRLLLMLAAVCSMRGTCRSAYCVIPLPLLTLRCNPTIRPYFGYPLLISPEPYARAFIHMQRPLSPHHVLQRLLQLFHPDCRPEVFQR